MTIRGLIATLGALWIVFASITFALPPAHVFHLLNAILEAVGLLVIAAYWPGVRDAWRRGDGISPSHLVTTGIALNWISTMARLGRWYFTATEPSNGSDQWIYNIGLWGTICAAFLLVGGVALSEPRWSRDRVGFCVASFVALSLVLWYCDYLFPLEGHSP